MLPYKTLYIYEIQGHFPRPEETFSDGFIGCWYEADYSFLFFSSPNSEEVQRKISAFPELIFRSETILDYKNWETGRDFTSFQVGKFFIFPFWERVEVPQGLIPIKLDPGVVFGSGCHATTRKCLEGIEYIYQDNVLETVLDLGCGTGILSIAAAKLGATKIFAVDCNNLAVKTARKNITINKVEKVVEVIEGDAVHWTNQEADFVCANIDSRTIEKLLDIPGFYNKKWYILSGMFGTEVNLIKEKLKDFPLSLVKILQENFWFTLIGKRN